MLNLLEWLISRRQERKPVGRDMKKNEHFCIVSGSVDRFNHYGEQYWGSSNLELPYNPAIPFIVYSSKKKTKTLTQKDVISYVHCSIIYNNQNMEAT